MKINDIVHGFQILNIRELPDTHGTLYEMKHVKTGAQLIWHARKDDNKTFAITFKTIPSDDTGVFHILEHSVLNGSAKYPVREPFVELLKGSMQTFLNAFTYPDKTMYPVSSRNEKDFMNLMSVYMDAVFHPAIYTNPNIFYQEGWHYEIREKEADPVYKGVVLNEMKGAFSSVDESIVDELNRMLFADNCYQYVSGGDPAFITDLSYEQFLATHKKFYNPSNASVWLDVDIEIRKVLEFLDEEYFSKYEKEDFDFTIPMQEVTPSCTHEITYELAPGDAEEDRTQIAIAKIVSSFDNIEKNLAWAALSNMLVANNESPLKKSFIEKGLCEDVELELYDGIQQPWAVLVLRNTDRSKFDVLKEELKMVSDSLLHNGIDHEQIIATINQMEFRYREKHEPAGLMYGQRAMEAWLYDGDPAQNLNIGSVFDSLRAKVEEGYYEKLWEEFLCGGNLKTVIAVPSKTLGAERQQKEEQKLLAKKKEWGDTISSYIALNEKLDVWQATPDTPEQLATLPRLSLSDISEKPFRLYTEERNSNGIPIYLHPVEDTGIVYFTLFFSLGGVTADMLPSVGLWSYLFTNLPTKEHTVEQLQGAIRKDIGLLNFFVDAYTPTGERESCIPVIGVTCSVLKQNMKKAIDLIQEILYDTVFEPDAILSLLKQDNEDFRQGMIANGHNLAMRRTAAHYSAEGVFREMVGGYASGLYEKRLEEHYEEEKNQLMQDFQLYSDVIFVKERMTASVTGEENLPLLEELMSHIHSGEGMRAKMRYPFLKDKKEYLVIPGGVSYSSCGNNVFDLGATVDPRMNVVSHLLTYDYLWSEVRVKGGAYGTGFTFSATGTMQTYSYRDPDTNNALQAYRSAGAHLKDLSKDTSFDLTQMIIGSLASGEPLLSPAAAVRLADVWQFRGVTYEQRCMNRQLILQMTTEQLGEFSDLLSRGMAEGAVCIIGSEENCKHLSEEGYTELEHL